MAEAKTYLDVNSLCKNIGDLTIVDNASFSVLERQKLDLLGVTARENLRFLIFLAVKKATIVVL